MSDDPDSGPLSPKDRLLRAAVELFTKRGYAATSVREIVEAAGVTKPVLYYHFGSKERLYREILNAIQRLVEEALVRLTRSEGSARTRLEILFFGLFELFEEYSPFVRFINFAFWGPPQGAPPFDFETFHLRLTDAIRPIVERGMTAGELRRADPGDVSIAFLGVLSFAMDLELAHPELGLGKAGLGRLLELVFSGVASPVAPNLLQETTS